MALTADEKKVLRRAIAFQAVGVGFPGSNEVIEKALSEAMEKTAGLSDDDARKVIDSYKTKKNSALLAQKESLEARLADVNAAIVT